MKLKKVKTTVTRPATAANRPQVPVKLGEHLAFDEQSRTWKKWGRDAQGIYAVEVS